MHCSDPLTLMVLLLRYALWVASGVELETIWQGLRSLAVKCVTGPLG